MQRLIVTLVAVVAALAVAGHVRGGGGGGGGGDDDKPKKPATQAASSIEVVEVSEARGSKRYRGKWIKKQGLEHRLDVEFTLDSPAARRAERVRNVVVDEAVDDTGRDLSPTRHEDEELWRSRQEFELGRQKRRPPKDDGGLAPPRKNTVDLEAGPPIEPAPVRTYFYPSVGARPAHLTLSLDPAARNATAIKRFRGHFELRSGGKRQVVAIEKPASRSGRELDDPQLKEAKLRVTIEPPIELPRGIKMPAEMSAMVSLKIEGDADALVACRVRDADGKVLGESEVDDEDGGNQPVIIRLGRPLDDSMKLELETNTGDDVVVVPFDVQGVPLP